MSDQYESTLQGISSGAHTQRDTGPVLSSIASIENTIERLDASITQLTNALAPVLPQEASTSVGQAAPTPPTLGTSPLSSVLCEIDRRIDNCSSRLQYLHNTLEV